jgi:hypothetical protein
MTRVDAGIAALLPTSSQRAGPKPFVDTHTSSPTYVGSIDISSQVQVRNNTLLLFALTRWVTANRFRAPSFPCKKKTVFVLWGSRERWYEGVASLTSSIPAQRPFSAAHTDLG